MSTDLDASAILAAQDRQLVRIDIPEWGGAVWIRPMSGSERDSFDAEMVGQANRMANIRARLVVRVACDKDGKRLFRDDQAAALGEKASGPLERIFIAAQKLNGIGASEVAAAGKDSGSVPSASSGSG